MAVKIKFNAKAFDLIRKDIYDKMDISTNLVLNTVRKKMTIPGKGIVYKRGGITHRASSPGDPPARDQSHLIDSAAKEIEWRGKTCIGTVGTDSKYARALEFGYAPRNLLPRPAWRPAIYENKEKIKKIFSK